MINDKLVEIRAKGVEISLTEAAKKLSDSPSPFLIDIREGEELGSGLIPTAKHIPRGLLELKIQDIVPSKESALILYCASGVRSLLAANTLNELGYTEVVSLAGGFNAWKAANKPIQESVKLKEHQRERYRRHITMPEIEEEGQVRLLNSKALLIGAGGLGSPAAYYLAAAGVGKLGIVDSDTVEESNLQRQILHSVEMLDKLKVESAEKQLKQFSPNTQIATYPKRLDNLNVEEIFSDYDIIVDGSDNFPTRYLVNDACAKMKKPFIFGSVFRFEGQVSVFDLRTGGPCYRCLYPEPPPADMAPSCAEAGVLGVLPGVVGLIQATEAIKVLLSLGEVLESKLLTYDALSMDFNKFKVRQRSNCAYCNGTDPFPGYSNYKEFCSA